MTPLQRFDAITAAITAANQEACVGKVPAAHSRLVSVLLEHLPALARGEEAAEGLRERYSLLRVAGTTLSAEVERLRAAMDAWSTRGDSERLVAEWRPLSRGSRVEVLWAEGPCRARFPSGLARDDVDAELLVAGLLRVGPFRPRPRDDEEEGPAVLTEAAVHPMEFVFQARPAFHLEPSALGVDRANPTALALALYDTLRAVVEHRLFIREEPLAAARLLLMWVRGSVERLREARPPQAAGDEE